MDWDTAVKEFITLWVVIDPIGTIPVFLAVTAGLSAAQQKMIALRATLAAGLILLAELGQVLASAQRPALIAPYVLLHAGFAGIFFFQVST